MNKTRTKMLEDLLIKKEKMQSNGNSLKVENTAEGLNARILEIASNRLFQEKREGYNKFNCYLANQNLGGVDVTYDENTGIITMNGTCTETKQTTFSKVVNNIKTKANIKYTMQLIQVGGTYTFGGDSAYGESSVQIWDNSSGSWKYPYQALFKAMQNSKLIISHVYDVDVTYNQTQFKVEQGDVFENFKFKIQFSEGDEKTYEQYGVMPSLQYESEVEGVTGDVKFKSQNKNCFSEKANNAFVNMFKNRIVNGVTYTDIENKLVMNGTVNANNYSNDLWFISNYLNTDLKDYINSHKGTYSLSTTIGLACTFVVRSIIDNTVGYIDNKVTITDEVILTGAYISAIYGQTYTNQAIEIQLEEGEKTEFTEHKENDFLISLENRTLYGNETARNKIVKRNGKYYFGFNWKKYVFTGDEPVYKNSDDINNYLYYFINIISANPINSNSLSNYLKRDTLANINNNNLEGFYINQKGTTTYINIHSIQKSNTPDEIKTYLKELYDAGKPLYIVYPLAETEYEEITDETLINQLDKLEFIKEYDEVTNFDFDKEVVFEIEVEKDNIKIINSRLDELEKQNINTQALSLESEV